MRSRGLTGPIPCCAALERPCSGTRPPAVAGTSRRSLKSKPPAYMSAEDSPAAGGRKKEASSARQGCTLEQASRAGLFAGDPPRTAERCRTSSLGAATQTDKSLAIHVRPDNSTLLSSLRTVLQYMRVVGPAIAFHGMLMGLTIFFFFYLGPHEVCR